jgi:hypothetical protein
MGLLTVGKALTPEEVQKISAYIRHHGILQFLHTWNRVKGKDVPRVASPPTPKSSPLGSR